MIEFSEDFHRQFAKLKKEDRKLVAKVFELILDTSLHPREGMGKPKPLRHHDGEVWARRISQKHRLLYTFQEDVILFLDCHGHYDDK